MPRSRKKRASKGTTLSPRRRQGRPRSSPWRLAAFLAVAALVLGMGAFLLKPVVFPERSDVSDALPLEISMDGFSQTLVRGSVGRPVNILMINLDTPFHTDGGGQHNFVVDELGVRFQVPPKGKMLLSFTPDRPGTFEFYCDIC